MRTERVGDLVFGVLGAGEEAGSGSPEIVLVHGIGVSHRYYERLHARLARTARVASIDLPGFGGLPKPHWNPSIGDMAAALAEVLDRLEVRQAVLVGQSMGAQWVTELAVRRPDLASRVVLIGPVSDERHRTAFSQGIALLADILREPPHSNLTVLTDYVRCGPRWFGAQLQWMLSYRLEDAVAQLTMPLLLLRGARDPIAGLRWCRRLRSRARAARLVLVPKAPHNAQTTAPVAVASAVLDFVAADVVDAVDSAHAAHRTERVDPAGPAITDVA
ncbi:alpha/beta fold hydrolase [Cnuibacter sp. UC19_7]|uniref:alpha/beta fold hydrolase n=1 Tax=Cnuibacter sp. UC19_7 TaxID=3350166 RepID=UPI00366FD448